MADIGDGAAADAVDVEARTERVRRRPAAWQVFDVVVAVSGIAAGLSAALHVRAMPSVPALVCVGVTALLVRVPVRLARADGGVEIGLDSAVLIFLLLTGPAPTAVALWVAGQVLGQLLAPKSWSTRAFNVGLSSWCAVASTAVAYGFGLRPGPVATSPRALLPVLVAALACFLTDYLLTVVSLLLYRGRAHASELVDRALPLTLLCFLGLDAVGLLGAAVSWRLPHWELLLLSAPLVGILGASWAYTRNKEQTAVLAGLLRTAEKVHAASDIAMITGSLVTQASTVLLAEDARLQDDPPGEGEIGVRVTFLPEPKWLVCGRRLAGRRYGEADRRAIEGLVRVASSAAERNELLSKIAFEALHDPVTGLGNRTHLLRELAVAVGVDDPQVSLVVIDIDTFKEINDTLGHHVGDRVLAAVAGRLVTCIREGDIVTRLGGDEFAVVVHGDDLAASSATQRMLDAIRRPIEADSVITLQVRASAGIARWAGESPEELLRNADLAMYAAKRDGKDRWRAFEADMLERTLDRVELERDLRHAVEDEPEQLMLHYQPVVDLGTGEVTGLEALLRWNHPVRGMIPPLEFIPLAENTGLIHKLGRWVVTQAYCDALRWVGALRRPLTMSVNVSPQQLEDRTFVRYVLDLVRGGGSDVRLVLELTETAFVAGERMMGALNDLRAAGVHLAIDDFGTGYSALSYLRDLPVDHLKVDRSFVRDVADDPRSASLVEVIHGVARSLGLTIIAEGVETTEQAEVLSRLGCSFAQGYLFSRPVATEDVESVLRRVLPAAVA